MKNARFSRWYLSLTIGVFADVSPGGYMQRNIFGVALSKVAAILIATAPIVGGDAPEH